MSMKYQEENIKLTEILQYFNTSGKGYSISCNCVLREGLGTDNLIYGF